MFIELATITGWAGYFVMLAIMLAGMFISILGLPGVWLMVGAAGLFAWVTRFDAYLSSRTLVILLILALLSELVEFLAGAAGARSAGGSRRATAGAIIGGLLGGIFLTFIPIPVVSTIVGVCLGCFIGAAVVELSIFADVSHALRVGTGAAKGRLLGMISKLIFCAIILLITLFAAFPIHSARAMTKPPISSPTTLGDGAAAR